MVSIQRNLFESSRDMQLISRNLFNVISKNILSRNLTAAVLNTNIGSNVHINNYSTQAKVPRIKTTKSGLLQYPVQSLDETLAKLLITSEPFLSKSELREAKLEIINFKNGVGTILQNYLEALASKEENWLSDRWLRTAYLSYRETVVVYSSPGMIFPTQTFKSDEDYLQYTSRVIYGALKYKELIDNNLIPTFKMKNIPLDNSQFYKIFGTCRIPCKNIDKMQYNPDSKHIVIIYKNNFYKMPVLGDDGKVACPNKIIHPQLAKIVSEKKPKGVEIGLLTSDNRDNWAEAYEILAKNHRNANAIKDIQTSIFTVSLDAEVPCQIGNNDMVVAAEQLIHGGGTKYNSANRWFDKTIQIIVNRSGVNGFCYEHSPAEGVAIAMMTDFIIKSIKDNDIIRGITNCEIQPYTQLEFAHPKEISPLIQNASLNINKLAEDLEIRILHFKKYGKELPKFHKLSPDSYIQIAIQLAFYMIHETPGCHYESAHLRIFTNGRTEAIRSCSNESIEFAKSMVLTKNTDEQRLELLRKAVNAHNAYAGNAILGKGIDRHLLGLKLMAIENELPIPEFFNSKPIVRSSTFRLSTSQVPSANEAFMAYGPLTQDGYGCCYNPRNDDIFFAISSWSSNKKTSSEMFAKSLYTALKSMETLIEKSNRKPTSKL